MEFHRFLRPFFDAVVIHQASCPRIVPAFDVPLELLKECRLLLPIIVALCVQILPGVCMLLRDFDHGPGNRCCTLQATPNSAIGVISLKNFRTLISCRQQLGSGNVIHTVPGCTCFSGHALRKWLNLQNTIVSIPSHFGSVYAGISFVEIIC